MASRVRMISASATRQKNNAVCQVQAIQASIAALL
jgi:hypothetical protein